MKKRKKYTIAAVTIVGITLVAGGIDIAISKGITKKQDNYRNATRVEFTLTPGFRRQVKTVRNRDVKPESPATFDLKCMTTKSVYDQKTKSYNYQKQAYKDPYVDIRFHREDKHVINVEKDLTKRINIVVRGESKYSDPVIIIKTLGDKSICQDYQREVEVEKLDAKEQISKEIWPTSIPKGTYYMWIGDFDYVTTNYQIIISED